MNSKREEHEVLLKRAVQAREAAGYSLSDAARLLGFNNYQSLSALEKGKRNINAHELSAMAVLYGRSLDYFFESHISPDPTLLWRKTTEQGVKQVQRKFLSFLENYSNLESLFGLERRWKDIQRKYVKADFQDRKFQLADKLGVEICDFLNLGSRPASNLLNVLENDLRFKILHLPLKNGISGASVVDDTLGVGILINAKDVPWRRSFDLAHELFHIVTWGVFTHKEVGDGSVRTKPEQYANAFASSLLLPELDLRRSFKQITIDDQIRIVDIIELAKEFGVSTQAVLWRLVNLEILERSKVEKAVENSKLLRIDRERRQELYYQGKPSKFPARYIYLACRCLIEGKISRGTFARYLEIDRVEVDRYLKKQSFLEETYEKIAFT